MDEDSSTEQRTRPVYSFGKIEIRLHGLCVCDQKQEEQKPGAEPADMEGETLIAMVTKAVTAIIGRLQSELPHLCAWMNVCSFSFFTSTFLPQNKEFVCPEANRASSCRYRSNLF